jgi:hypothetical protein
MFLKNLTARLAEDCTEDDRGQPLEDAKLIYAALLGNFYTYDKIHWI